MSGPRLVVAQQPPAENLRAHNAGVMRGVGHGERAAAVADLGRGKIMDARCEAAG